MKSIILTTEFGDSSMEYKCETCKYCLTTEEIENCGWVGLVCTRVVILQECLSNTMTYLVAAGEAPSDVRMIVHRDHLCVLWEEKV